MAAQAIPGGTRRPVEHGEPGQGRKAGGQLLGGGEAEPDDRCEWDDPGGVGPGDHLCQQPGRDRLVARTPLVHEPEHHAGQRQPLRPASLRKSAAAAFKTDNFGPALIDTGLIDAVLVDTGLIDTGLVEAVRPDFDPVAAMHREYRRDLRERHAVALRCVLRSSAPSESTADTPSLSTAR